MRKKEVVAKIKLKIPAGQANPSPPIGPALGQKGLNIMDFCNKFNQLTKDFEKGTPTPVVIHAYGDKSFDFFVGTPPVSYLVMKMAGLKKGAKLPGREVVKEIKRSSLREVALIKQKDLNLPLESIVSMVAGTARSMGIRVVED